MTCRISLYVLGDDADEVLPLPFGQALTVGRADDVDLFLNDAGVSRRHCQVEHCGDHATIEDLGSRGGTYVNGMPIQTRVQLRDCDELQVGGIRLMLRVEPVFGAKPTVPRPDATVVAGPPPGEGANPVGLLSEQGEDRKSGAMSVMPLPPVFQDHDAGALTIRTESSECPTAPAAALIVPLGRGTVLVGRAPTCDLALESPTVSRRHAEFTFDNTGYTLRDLDTPNGTFVGGQPITGARTLRPGDSIRIGPYEFSFDGARLISTPAQAGTRITVRGLGKQVIDRQNGWPVQILRNINLTVEPGEFVGVFGPSGCGKSTFMDALNGRRPATEGSVYYNGENLYRRFDAFKRGIGYVPQELILHEQLPVCDALRYASQLRLPGDTSADEIERNIERTLEIVGLSERRHTLIKHLSGGQKKRVSIAMELLCRPTLLYLDEVTSGLDLGTEVQMMRLFRRLADSGVTTLCITHYVDSLDMCDMVVFLVRGRLAFYGPPDELKRYLGVNSMREAMLMAEPPSAKPKSKGRTAEAWEAAFRESTAYARYVQGRADRIEDSPGATVVEPGQAMESMRSEDKWRQFKLLTRRYVQVVLGDRRNLAIMLALAPMIAFLACIVLNTESGAQDRWLKAPAARDEDWIEALNSQRVLCFVSAISMFFLGVFGGVREVVKELAIYRHERFLNLEISPYLASKIVPLAAIAAIQAFELMLVLAIGEDFAYEHTAALSQFVALWLTGVSAVLLGLAISCATNTADKATLLMVVAIIPQVLFANALLELSGVSEYLAQWFVVTYWSFQSLQNLTWVEMRVVENAWYWGSLIMLLLSGMLYFWVAGWLLRRKDGPLGKPYCIPFVHSGTWVVVKTRVRWAVATVLERGSELLMLLLTIGQGSGEARRHPPCVHPPRVYPERDEAG